ncbi:MAG: tRNA (N(6)-L-threonylcarbamoyladenosine(37)-C(2))-methylthiotransferase MtaB [Deltaproteobacteria bacterium]|nr:tRNA (N(6)-L-threonylcarbamoyladenosine(37)-C(2))-methylthiotransferase MtaB [Deltaproteobacteria bacterium]
MPEIQRIAIETLGCKVNQFESAAIEEQLRAKGHTIVPFSQPADAYIINTCTVTAKADFQSRQLIRRAMRTNPAARIIVTGCYVQTASRELLEFCQAGNVCLVGNDQKFNLANYLIPHNPDNSFEIYVGAIEEVKNIRPFTVEHFPRRTRAFLRIQDGCNAFCSYCIVPYARGRSRSLPPVEALKQTERLVEGGYQEIVLSGINLGRYGRDITPPTSLYELLVSLEKVNGLRRIRLSSIEPAEITKELVTFMAKSEVICPHFHIPLQSGSTETLKRMNRHYTAEFYRDMIGIIHTAIPMAAIGTDVMVGFPGEGEKEFKETYDLLSKLPITYLHVFRYSARRGTAAYAFPESANAKAATLRAGQLKEMGLLKKKTFYFRNLGQETSVLIEGRDRHSKLYKGLTPNYIPVLIDTKGVSINGMIDVKIERILGDQVIGVLLSSNRN